MLFSGRVGTSRGNFASSGLQLDRNLCLGLLQLERDEHHHRSLAYLHLMSFSKHQRTDEQEPGQVISRSSMWLDDGSIILHAENTQFRVHRSVLAMNSTVFQDMFGIPQPQREPTVDGCPIVHLSDSAQEVEHVLNALYKRYALIMMRPSTVFLYFHSHM